MPAPPAKPGAPPSASEAAQAKLKAKEAKKEKRAAALAARPEAAPEASTSKAGAAAASGQGGKGGAGKDQAGPSRKPDGMVGSSKATPATAAPAVILPQDLLFSHLPSAHEPDSYVSTSKSGVKFKPHTIVARVGQMIASGELKGTNARVMGLLSAFKEVIRDFGCPPEQMHRLLPAHISPMIAYLDHCRPKGVGGGNAIRWLKGEINRVGTDPKYTTESQQREALCDAIDDYIEQRISLAAQVISDEAREKFRAGDVIVTFARSSLVEQILLDAWAAGQGDFSVIVVDSGPLFEGKDLLKVLVAMGIPCTYCLLPSLPAAIPRATKVLLGAAAMLSDGALYSRAGTAMVAMLAKENRVPVIACCEGYKFGDKVVLDAVTGNEKGHVGHLPTQQTPLPTLSRINLMYDLTPPALITMVCTEVGNIPPSSVPTVMTRGDAEAL